MKILAIMGSPRKGNSYKLTRLIEDRLKTKGEIYFEYLFLKDTELANCIGCHLCVQRGEEFCPLHDDRDHILKRMEEADGVIFVSPVYMFTITALMKNFVDHLAFLVHRPIFSKNRPWSSSTGGICSRNPLNTWQGWPAAGDFRWWPGWASPTRMI